MEPVTVNLEFKGRSKEEWLKQVPELIKTLKKDYNFYYNGLYAIITKDITEIVAKNADKHKHKMILYKNKDKRWFLVVFTKNRQTIYYCNDYKEATDNQISYFVRKFKKFYKQGENIRNEEIIKSIRSQSTNVEFNF